MPFRLPLPAAVLVTAVFLAAPAANAVEVIPGCTGVIASLPATISTAGVWCLPRSLTTAINSGTVIQVNANNVTLDCRGFLLGGLSAGPTSTAYGIRSDRMNTRVRNCHLRGFPWSVVLEGDGGLVEDGTIEAAAVTAIHLAGNGHEVRRMRFLDTGGGAQASTAVVLAGGTATVHDNFFSGISSTAASVIGVSADHGVLAMHDNTMAGLVSGPGSSAYAVVLTDSRATVERNRLTSDTRGVGIVCCRSTHVVRDNTFNSFAAMFEICTDGGGNVFVTDGPQGAIGVICETGPIGPIGP